MSVLIKGMEMPKSCYSCNFCQYYAEPNQGCYCLALFVDLHRTNFVKERLTNCPLIEVPTPHGRLIDADAIPWIKGKDEQDKPIYLLLKLQVKELPTIIESEGE